MLFLILNKSFFYGGKKASGWDDKYQMAVNARKYVTVTQLSFTIINNTVYGSVGHVI